MYGRKKSVVRAVVQDIVQGKHGPYAVTTAEGIKGSLTFSMDPSVWKGETSPENGEIVHLKKLKRKQAGWRAMHAEPHSISERESAMSNKQLAKKVNQIITLWNQIFRFEKTEDVWKEWVDFKRREWRDLHELMVDGSYQESFKARALFLVLTPEDDVIPFYWKGSRGYRDFLMDSRNPVLPKLSVDLAKFGAQLVTLFFQFAKDESKLEEFKRENLLRDYNNLSIELLSVLPSQSDEARSLFSGLELNDPTAWWNMDFASGYNPFSRLIQDARIPEVWKRRADDALREIIREEVTGKRKPREEHEEALGNYIYAVMAYLYYLEEGKEIYSRTLFLDQVRFILNITPDIDGQKFYSFRIGGVLRVAREAGEQKLIRDIARFAYEQDVGFLDTDVVEQLKEASQGEPEIEEHYQDMIFEKEQSTEKRKHQEHALDAKEQAILDQMKD